MPQADAAAVILELINAAEAKMDAMYNSDLELAWREESARWSSACTAAYALPEVQALIAREPQ